MKLTYPGYSRSVLISNALMEYLDKIEAADEITIEEIQHRG